MLCIAPRNSVEEDAVEEICSTTWRFYRLRAIERKAIDLELATQSSPDDLECVLYACRALAGKDPDFRIFLQRHETRLQNIIRRSFARIRTLRQIGEEELDQTTPAGHTPGEAPAGPAGCAQCAPEP
jgi:hypothetical protein